MKLIAGPLKQEVPERLMCQKCEGWMRRTGGYLMGGWNDWCAYYCDQGHRVFWKPDKP